MDEINKDNDWVEEIHIDDMLTRLACIADDKHIDFCNLSKFFDENLVDYDYVKAHKRRDFLTLMKKEPYNIKVGKAAKIWKILCELSE